MPNRNADLHGSAPDNSVLALLLIDVNGYALKQMGKVLKADIATSDQLDLASLKAAPEQLDKQA